MRRSKPRSSQIQFLNLTPVNPLISKCEIKVLYAGPNRNKSFITKDIANSMAKSLPGTPIVGQYVSHSKDFGDHGEDQLVIDSGEMKFVSQTVPYGFVDLNAKVWWKNCLDPDGVEREYLMTEGFLWTGRYPETTRVFERGNGQSMELHQDSLVGEWSNVDGEWASVENENEEYFFIKEANFSALCILGTEVEPCFEGATISKTSFTYSLNEEKFKEQMLEFMNDLKEALSIKGGAEGMPEENLKPGTEQNEDNENANGVTPEEDFAKKKKKDDEEDKKDPKDDNSDNNDDNSDDNDNSDDEEDKKKKKKKYSLEEVVEYQELLERFTALESQFNSMNTELETIRPEYSRLLTLEKEVVTKQKDEMIDSFYMLSDDLKAEVVENKDKYSVEEIESKLSIICVRNKVNFSLEDNDKNDKNTEAPITTFNVDNNYDSTPAWLKAVDRITKK